MILERINIMNTKLKHLQIGDLTARLPIIQGGMGVGVSFFQAEDGIRDWLR